MGQACVLGSGPGPRAAATKLAAAVYLLTPAALRVGGVTVRRSGLCEIWVLDPGMNWFIE